MWAALYRAGLCTGQGFVLGRALALYWAGLCTGQGFGLCTGPAERASAGQITSNFKLYDAQLLMAVEKECSQLRHPHRKWWRSVPAGQDIGSAHCRPRDWCQHTTASPARPTARPPLIEVRLHRASARHRNATKGGQEGGARREGTGGRGQEGGARREGVKRDGGRDVLVADARSGAGGAGGWTAAVLSPALSLFPLSQTHRLPFFTLCFSLIFGMAGRRTCYFDVFVCQLLEGLEEVLRRDAQASLGVVLRAPRPGGWLVCEAKSVRPRRCSQVGAAKSVQPSRYSQVGAAKSVQPSQGGMALFSRRQRGTSRRRASLQHLCRR
eukprot:359784-Chlamydomonas_euryale.AAC.1